MQVECSFHYFFLGATFATTTVLALKISFGKGQAIHCIFAATNSRFQVRNVELAAKDAVPVLCAKPHHLRTFEI